MSFAWSARDPVWTDTWVIVGVFVLIALSTGISYGQAGILSMSQGAFAAIGGYAAAVSTLRFRLPPGIDLLIAAALPALLAYGLARLVTRLTPLATALATLALGSVIEIALRNMGQYYRGLYRPGWDTRHRHHRHAVEILRAGLGDDLPMRPDVRKPGELAFRPRAQRDQARSHTGAGRWGQRSATAQRRVRVLGGDRRIGRLALRALHQLHQSELA